MRSVLRRPDGFPRPKIPRVIDGGPCSGSWRRSRLQVGQSMTSSPSDARACAELPLACSTPDSGANLGGAKFSSPSVMRLFFFCFALGGMFEGSRAQISDTETTLGPLPPSSFSCRGRAPGYYADTDTGCRAYHVCDGNSHFTYLCPPRTLFRQQTRICDHAYLVPCNDYLLDDDFYPVVEDARTEDGDLVFEPEQNRLKEDELPEIRATEIVPGDEDLQGTTENFTTGKLLDLTTSEPTAITQLLTSTSTSTPTSSARPQPEKYLKFSIKDLRSWFFIPEFNQNSITGSTVREVFVPIDGDTIHFRDRPRVRASKASSCPAHCEPRFLLPGTCRPCVMIK